MSSQNTQKSAANHRNATKNVECYFVFSAKYNNTFSPLV